MKGSKQDINNLLVFFLKNKKLSASQKKRRNNLILRDYETIVKEDEKDGGEKGPEPAPPTDDEEIKIQAGNSSLRGVSYISPKYLHDFLYGYNQDPFLKYTSHLIDSEDVIADINKACITTTYDFSKHIKLLQQSFYNLLEKLKEEYPDVDKMYMVSRARRYLFGSKDGKGTWGSDKIDINWSSQSILDWAKDNPGIIPNPGKNIAKKQRNIGFKLPSHFKSDVTGKRIFTFADLVIYFKSLFHIRLDNSLRSLIELKNKDVVWNWDKEINIKIDVNNFPANIEIFTDVDKLLQAYYKILSICKQNQKKEYGTIPEIILSLFEKGEHVYFCIHHKNSIYGKSPSAASRLGTEQGELISKNLNGLCNLYIEADFGQNQYYRIDLWSPQGGKKEKLKKKTEGVKYIMEF